ncbi:MAG: hypothetical protein EOP51_10925 [Sphingobacteriales bacterium]|nr:MAG: hypothetical protein EOP51_10925 [Sphingobacteriales bacterium]
MKNTAIATFALFALLLWGCSKNSNSISNNPYYGEESGPFTYKVENVRDTALEQSGDVVMVIQVKKLSGAAQDVQMTATDLPEGMAVTYDPAVAKPPFNAIVRVKTDRVKAGSYIINLKSYNKETDSIAYPMTLTVKPYSKTSTSLVGSYNTTGACTPQTGSFEHNSKIEAVAGSTDKVNIFGLWTSSWNIVIQATITDVEKGTLVIPSQDLGGGLTYEGTGTFDRNTIHLNYTVSGQVVNETCTSTMTRE